MKKINLPALLTGIFSILTVPVFAQGLQEVITVETFGTNVYDTNGPNKSTDGTLSYFKWDEITGLRSKNGHIEGGEEKSIRINTYLADVNLEDYEKASKGVAVCLHPATKYNDALWSVVTFVEIDITRYEDLKLGFGFAKRAGFGAVATEVGLNVNYSIDGSDWNPLETSGISNPLDLGVWEWEEMSINDVGIKLSIQFLSPLNNDIMLDDITVKGVKNTTSVKSDLSAEAFSVFPNPVVDNLTIHTGTISSTEYEIFSITGASLLKGEVSGSNKTINLNSLNKGVYMLSLKSDGIDGMIKIIK
jgi:hypothetical protein